MLKTRILECCKFIDDAMFVKGRGRPAVHSSRFNCGGVVCSDGGTTVEREKDMRVVIR